MNDDTLSNPTVKKSSRGRKLAWLALGLLVFLVVAYFVVTSSGFLKSVVLPRLSRALNAQVTVEQISLRPFSRVEMRQLKVQPTGREPLLQAEEVMVQYSLLDIIKGNINIKDIKLVRPVLQVVEDATGKNNLAPLLETEKKAEPSAPAKSSATRMRLDKLDLSQGTVRWIQNGSHGQQRSAEISGLNLVVSQLGNDQSGKAELAAQIKVAQRAAAGAAVDQLSANLSGGYQFKLDPSLKPLSIEGQQRLVVGPAEGAWRDFASLGVQLDCQMTPTEIQTLSCQFERQSEKLGQLRVSGPLDLVKNEGRLRLEIRSLDRQVLNLLGAMGGWDFGDSQLNSTNQVAFENQGNLIAANGSVRGTRLTLGQQQARTPEVDLDFSYQFTWDAKAQTFLLQRLGLTGTQKGQDFVSLSLERPMNLSWGDNRVGFKESALVATVTNLNLADWRALAGAAAPEGLLNLELRTRAQQDGRQLNLEFKANARGLKVAASNQVIDIPQLDLTARGQVEDYTRITLDRLQFEVPGWIRGDASGNFNGQNQDTSGRLNLEANPTVSLQKWPVQNVSITKGTCKASVLYTSHLDNQQVIRTVNGSLALLELDGRCGDLTLDNYQLDVDYDATLRDNGQSLEIKKLNVAPRSGFDRGGSLDLSGKFNVTNHQAEINLTLLDFNQHAVAPLRTSMAALASVPSFSLNATAHLVYQPSGSSSIKADLGLGNLVLTNAENKSASPPLGLKAKLEAGLTGALVELRQCVLALGATANATNEISIQGRLDQSKTNVLAGQLSLQAEALDLTDWYQAWSRLSGATNLSATSSVPETTPATAAAEPAPSTLPMNPFQVDTKIGRLHLGEIVLSNLLANLSLANNEAILDPFQLSFNGAPVKGACKINLGVPGYVYDLSFQMDKAPMEPLVNTFMPEYREKYKGDLYALLQLKGAGVTGANLKKNLSGQMRFVVTNTSVSVLEPGLAKVLTFIPVVGNTLSAMSSSLLSTVATKLSLPELQQSAINALVISLAAGNGQIDLQKTWISSPAFQIDSVGQVPIADNFMDSPMSQPITLALSPNLAQKMKLATSADTNRFVALPSFIKASGTLGQPKQEYDYLKLTQLGAQVAAGFLGNTQAGNILKEIGNLNNVRPNDTNTSASTASTNTTAARVGTALGLVGALLGETNRAPAIVATNQPSATNQPAITNRTSVTNQSATNNPAGTTNQVTNTNTPANSRDTLIKEGLNLLPGLRNSSKTNQ